MTASEVSHDRITRSEILRHLDDVLSSPGFQGSTKYHTLLRYLVERSLADETPHEIDVAVDVFGKDQSYNPAESSSVRVYIYQLRKKLEEFYAERLEPSRIRFTIPKGSYRIAFGSLVLSSAVRQGMLVSVGSVRAARIALAVVSLLLVGSLLVNALLLDELDGAAGRAPPQPELAVATAWQDLVEGEEPILIALGDFFFFTDSSTYPDSTHFIRDIEVNSAEDLRSAQASKFGPAVLPSGMTYLPKATAFALQSILPVAQRTGKPVSLKLMSEVTGEDLRQNDVIYLGFVRSMGALQDYFFRSSNFSSDPPFLRLRDKHTGTTYSSSGDVYGQSEDYGLFSKLPGPGKGEIVVFTGIHDIGILHAVRALTDPDRESELHAALQTSLEASSGAVEILFKVSGYDRTDLEATIAMTSPPATR